MSDANPNSIQNQLAYLEVSAITLHKESMAGSMVDVSKRQQAIAIMHKAIALKETQRPPNGAPTPLKPVHELTAEMMLEMGMATEAVAMFEISLQRLKNRPWSLLGAARSYDKMNNELKAAENYQALLAIWSDDSHSAVKEAKEYLGR